MPTTMSDKVYCIHLQLSLIERGLIVVESLASRHGGVSGRTKAFWRKTSEVEEGQGLEPRGSCP